MNYTVFSDHIIGQSHVRMGAGCEDYSVHYCDEQGRYAIAAVCDGHSDPKCFRSAAGAELGCKTAVRVLRNLFDAYWEENETEDAMTSLFSRKEQVIDRLRAAFLAEWNRAVEEDLQRNPITEEEYQPLDCPQYRSAMKLYRAGQARNNIYGATLLAVAVCEHFHVVMHIGDGVVVRLDGEGVYSTPLPEDDRNEMEGPASMCDSDLLSRNLAFRVEFFPFLPQALFVTSDGVGDMPLSVLLRENLCTVQRTLMESEPDADKLPPLAELNDAQQNYLHTFLEHYAQQGLEDDCCLSGFFHSTQPVADVRLTRYELDELYRELNERIHEEEQQYLQTKERIEQAHRSNQARIQALETQIAQLQEQIARLEEQLGLQREDEERILSVREQHEQSHQNRLEQLDRQRTLVDQRYGDGAGAEPDEPASAPAEPVPPGREQVERNSETDGLEPEQGTERT